MLPKIHSFLNLIINIINLYYRYKNKTELKESSVVKISSSGEAHKLVITSAARADSGEYSCEVHYFNKFYMKTDCLLLSLEQIYETIMIS